MLFPIARLLEGRSNPLCILRTKAVREALELMIENDFSQLPIVDEHGTLIGVISEQSLIRRYFHLGEHVPLLGLDVGHCGTRPATLRPDADLFEALDRLKDVGAIVVVDVNNKPVGVLTDYDTTRFLLDVSEGLIHVEDIEVTLRQRIEAAFPDEHSRSAALFRAFGSDRRDSMKPAKEYEKFDFSDHVQFITHNENWPKLQGVFEPKDYFTHLLGEVGEIRNQLAHFRGRLTGVQRNILSVAREWMEERPRLPQTKPAALRGLGSLHVQASGTLSQQAVPNRLGSLSDWLRQQAREEPETIRVPLQDIEQLTGEPLPAAALEHTSWWTNEPHTHPLSEAWVRAGWRVEDIDLAKREVTFGWSIAARANHFLTDLSTRLQAARPELRKDEKESPSTQLSLLATEPGFRFVWTFEYNTLQFALRIDTGDIQKNKKVFDMLQEERIAIQEELDAALNWHELEPGGANTITAIQPARPTDPPVKLDRSMEWAVDFTFRFIDAFQRRLAKINLL